VAIADHQKDAIDELGKLRNRLQHFGLPTTAQPLVEARAAKVLSFLLDFVDQDLTPSLDPDESRVVRESLEAVRQGLGQIREYVRQRMASVRADLPPGRTVECPECGMPAMVVSDDGGSATNRAGCRFCNQTWADPREPRSTMRGLCCTCPGTRPRTEGSRRSTSVPAATGTRLWSSPEEMKASVSTARRVLTFTPA
jgi:hypothetical protein